MEPEFGIIELKMAFYNGKWRENSKIKAKSFEKKSTSRFRFLALSANCLSLKVWVFRDVCFMTERSIIWSWVKPIYGKILARLSLEKGLLTLRKERKKKSPLLMIFFFLAKQWVCWARLWYNFQLLTNNWWLWKKVPAVLSFCQLPSSLKVKIIGHIFLKIIFFWFLKFNFEAFVKYHPLQF